MKKRAIFDWAVIILGMSYGLSILSELFAIKGIGIVLPFTIFLIVSHLFRFGLRFSILRKLQQLPLVLLFFTIIFFDFLQSLLFLDAGNMVTAFSRMVYIFFFMSYISNVYFETNLDYLLKPYLCYSLYNVFVIALMAVLIITGVPWQQNEVSYQLLQNNIQDGSGATYYFPYFISVVAVFHEYSVFSLFPGITGLAHEPHVIMWIISPAIIMAMAYKTRKIWLVLLAVLYLFALLETFSTMALLAFGFVMVMHLIWLIKKRNFLIYIIPVLLIVFVSLTFFSETLNTIFEVIGMKTSSSGGSSDYSMDMLHYIFSFNGLFGYGNLPPYSGDINEAVDPNISAGLVTGVLDIVLYASLAIGSIRLTKSKKVQEHYIGLGFLYMLIHGLKVNFLVFGYPLFAFLVFVLQTIIHTNGGNICYLSEKSIFSKK